MKLVPILITGARQRIYGIDISDEASIEHCPAKDFIADMASASRKSLTAILNHHANHGAIFNPEKSRQLSDDIFEFKTRQGDRMYYFFAPGRRTILTHGSRKPKKLQLVQEVQRAARLREQYLQSGGAS